MSFTGSGAGSQGDGVKLGALEPGHPFQGCQFNRLPGFQGRPPMDQFSPVQPVDRLGQRVVLAVPCCGTKARCTLWRAARCREWMQSSPRIRWFLLEYYYS